MFDRFVTAIVAASLASSAESAVLWQNVESGMTVAQIQKAQPAAIANASPERLGDGATCDLVISSLAVGTDNYKVCFFMLRGGLHQVTLTALHPNKPVFETAVELLRGKYGPELAAGQPICRQVGYLETCEANWLLKSGTNISAVLLQVGGTDPVVNVVYQTRMAKDASKL